MVGAGAGDAGVGGSLEKKGDDGGGGFGGGEGLQVGGGGGNGERWGEEFLGDVLLINVGGIKYMSLGRDVDGTSATFGAEWEAGKAEEDGAGWVIHGFEDRVLGMRSMKG